jgi:hypothetical protein
MDVRWDKSEMSDVDDDSFFSDAALQPVYDLNESFVQLMLHTAERSASEAKPRLVAAIGPELLRLDIAARKRLAHCPIALVDFGFRNVEWWNHFMAGQRELPARLSPGTGFPRLQATQLAQTTITLAWTLVRANRDAGCVVFGVDEQCVAALTALSMRAIQSLPEIYPDCVRPRWERHPMIWHELLRVAGQPPKPRLPAVGVYALQRQLADAALRDGKPATGASVETNQSHR